MEFKKYKNYWFKKYKNYWFKRSWDVAQGHEDGAYSDDRIPFSVVTNPQACLLTIYTTSKRSSRQKDII